MAKLKNDFELHWVGKFEAERFWSRVKIGEPHECWNNKSRPNKWGHTQFKITGMREKQVLVYSHRIAWVLTHGLLVPEGLYVLHRCNNPRCCNPAHLYLGTLSDNSNDMTKAGTHPNQKFTFEQITRARLLRSEGWPVKDIANEIGCSECYVSAICNNQRRVQS